MKTAFEGQSPDPGIFVACAGIRQVLGIDVGNSRGNRVGFGAAVQAQETRVGHAARPIVSNFTPQALNKIDLADARRHDVCHHMWLIHLLEYGLGRVAKLHFKNTAKIPDVGGPR